MLHSLSESRRTSNGAALRAAAGLDERVRDAHLENSDERGHSAREEWRISAEPGNQRWEEQRSTEEGT
jgi:hypothetical protein